MPMVGNAQERNPGQEKTAAAAAIAGFHEGVRVREMPILKGFSPWHGACSLTLQVLGRR
jgi:hypothetical protein